MRNSKSLHQRLFKQKETNSDGDSSASSATTQDSMSTPTGADYNPIPLAKELSDLLKGSHSTTVARSDTLFGRLLYSQLTGRKLTLSKKFVVHYLSYPPLRWNQKGSLAPADFFLSKLRCNLNDSSLDMPIFLKFYIARNNRLVKGQYCD